MKKNQQINSQFIIVVVCLITVLVGSLALLYRWQYLTETEDNYLEYSLETSKQGDIVIKKDYAMVINSVKSDKTQIPGYWQIKDDQKFVVVDISFKNRTNYNYSMSPITSMKLIDENGIQYDVTSAVAITNGLGGEVAPHNTIRGEVGFTVPSNIAKFVFVFNYKQGDSQLFRTTLSLN